MKPLFSRMIALSLVAFLVADPATAGACFNQSLSRRTLPVPAASRVPLLEEQAVNVPLQFAHFVSGGMPGLRLTIAQLRRLTRSEAGEWNRSNFGGGRTKNDGMHLLRSDEVNGQSYEWVGMKAHALAGFGRFSADKGVHVNIPPWSLVPAPLVGTALPGTSLVAAHRAEFAEHLTALAEGSALRFGDADNPLLVSARASSARVRPGRYVTVLNIGINDATVRGLAKQLGSDGLAKWHYFKLIRDLAVESSQASATPGHLSVDSFSDKELQASHPERRGEALADWRIRAAKAIYEKAVGRPFPQDVYEQLSAGVCAAGHSYSRTSAGLEEKIINAVIIQRMRFGMIPGSFAGSTASRNPLTGRHEIFGTAGREAQGDDVLDGRGLEELERTYPAAMAEIQTLTQLAEEYLRDMAMIEFTIERDPIRGPVVYLLQVREGNFSPQARVQMLHDMAVEGIMSRAEALSHLEGINLRALRFAPIDESQIPADAVYIGQGTVASPGAVAGVAVFRAETARRYRQEGIPTMLVAPLITANDERSIQASDGVLAFRDLGSHAQSISLRFGVPAVVGITESQFDPVHETLILGSDAAAERIHEGESVLMIMPGGKVYLRRISVEALRSESLSRQKRYLEPALVELLRWQIEAEGHEAVFMVDGRDVGLRWNQPLINQPVNAWDYDRRKNLVNSQGRRLIRGVRDVVRGEAASHPDLRVEKKDISPATLERIIEEVVNRQDGTEGFTYHLWYSYDHMAEVAAKLEGVPDGGRVRYTHNLADSQKAYIRAVAERAPDAFVQAVFHGVDHHKNSQFIFRSFIISAFDKDFAKEFFLRVVRFGAEKGNRAYSGDIRAMDYQVARLFSSFVLLDKDFARSVLGELASLDPVYTNFLLQEIRGFYLVANLYAAAHDRDFASYEEMLSTLDQAAEANSGFASASRALRDGLRDRITERQKTQSALEGGWVLANHIFMSVHAAFLFPYYIDRIVQNLLVPLGWVPSDHIAFTPESFLVEIVTGLVFAVLTGWIAIWWHERGHFWQAVSTRTLTEHALAPALDAREAGGVKRFWLEVRMLASLPLGKFPGIARAGLGYHAVSPFNLSVAAAGPRASQNLARIVLPLGVFALVAAFVTGQAGLTIAARLLLGIGAVSLLDRLFSDPGKYKAFTEREKAARARRKSIGSAAQGRWAQEMAAVRDRMRATRIQIETKANGRRLSAPWGFRNSGMGGRHTEKEYPESNISLQEAMFVPLSATNYEDAQEMTVRLQTRLMEIINSAEGCRVMGIGLEGGLAAYITPRDGDPVPELRLWRFMKQSIEECGYRPGEDVALALDPAASELEIAYREKSKTEAVGEYLFWRDKSQVVMTREELLALYRKAIDEDIPIISIEDGFAEDDWEGFRLLAEEFGERLFRIGDDLVTTNDAVIERAADSGAINATLIKANQIGTLSETNLAILTSLGKGLDVVVSHRSKSPNDPMEAEIALAVHAVGLKAGGGANTERLVKYGAVNERLREAARKVARTDGQNHTGETDQQKIDDLISHLEITDISAREEGTNAGIPTVGVTVTVGIPHSAYEKVMSFTGATPLGTSAGTGEAIHLVDSMIAAGRISEQYPELFRREADGTYRFRKDATDKSMAARRQEDAELWRLWRKAQRWEGKGVQNAVRHVEEVIAPAFLGTKVRDLGNLTDIDHQLLTLELESARTQGMDVSDPVAAMQRKGSLGMNAILAVSLALTRVKAMAEGEDVVDLIRTQSIETMAKVVADHDGTSWETLAREKDWDSLVADLQRVALELHSENRPLYEVLRQYLPVYQLDIRHERHPQSVRPLSSAA